MVCAHLKLRFHRSTPNQRQSGPRHLDILQLQIPEVSQQLRDNVTAKLEYISTSNLENHWESLHDTVFLNATEQLETNVKVSYATYRLDGGLIVPVRLRHMLMGMI